MGAIFQSLGRTITAGVILLIIIVGIVMAMTSGTSPVSLSSHAYWAFLIRWLHIGSGVMWIGLLWYFNFVQTPSMPKIPDAEKPAVTKVIAPAALFWFRHAALWTVIFGLLLAGMNDYLGRALMLERGVHAIGIGMWLGLIMAFNVWFIIWPNQKKALGIVTVDADAKAKAARMAGMTSRLNTLLSIAMLYCMAAQSHGGL